MHVLSRALPIALSVSLLLPLAASAVGFALVQDDRRVSNAFSDGTPSASDTPEVGELDWSGAVPLASQQSSIGGSSMSGTGAASVFSDIEFGGGNTTFDVIFDVAQATPVEFLADFTYDNQAFGSLFFEAALTRGSDTLFRDARDGDSFPVEDPPFSGSFTNQVTFNGTLDPGTYRLLVRISSSGGNADGTFGFGFDVVPEPSTGVLVGAGLAVIAARRRGRAGASRP